MQQHAPLWLTTVDAPKDTLYRLLCGCTRRRPAAARRGLCVGKAVGGERGERERSSFRRSSTEAQAGPRHEQCPENSKAPAAASAAWRRLRGYLDKLAQISNKTQQRLGLPARSPGEADRLEEI